MKGEKNIFPNTRKATLLFTPQTSCRFLQARVLGEIVQWQKRMLLVQLALGTSSSHPTGPWQLGRWHTELGPGQTSEVRMLSSSRSKANGFSLRCCGSDLCRTRLPSPAPASRSIKAGANTESLSVAGASSGTGCFPSACGTGVQGCQEEVEGALHSALLSSTACLCWDGAEEPPGLTREADLMKDISCKDRGRVSAGWGWVCVQCREQFSKLWGQAQAFYTPQKVRKKKSKTNP